MKVEIFNDSDLIETIDFELARGISKGDFLKLDNGLYKVDEVCYVVGKERQGFKNIEKIQLNVILEE